MTIIFDFDGTICDSLPIYLRAYNDFLTKRSKKTITKNQFRKQGVLKIASKEHISKISLVWYLFLARRYARRHIHEMQPFPGMVNQIHKLASIHTLGIVTSNSKANVTKFIKLNDLENCFSFVESKLSYFNKGQKIQNVIKKHNIDKRTSIYVGDETRDIKAAQSIGIKALSVTWGFEDTALLLKCKPDITITKPSNLYKSLSKTE